jgi:hypothetical protein
MEAMTTFKAKAEDYKFFISLEKAGFFGWYCVITMQNKRISAIRAICHMRLVSSQGKF